MTLPLDKRGHHFLNDHLVRHSNARIDSMRPALRGSKPYVEDEDEGREPRKEKGESSRIHFNDDGSVDVTHPDGAVSGPHPHPHAAFARIAAERGGGLHHFAHLGDDGSITTHSVDETGDIEGPREHGSPDGAMTDMGRFFKGEYGEAPGGGTEQEGNRGIGRDSTVGRDRERTGRR
jgi:hypothetical protein